MQPLTWQIGSSPFLSEQRIWNNLNLQYLEKTTAFIYYLAQGYTVSFTFCLNVIQKDQDQLDLLPISYSYTDEWEPETHHKWSHW